MTLLGGGHELPADGHEICATRFRLPRRDGASLRAIATAVGVSVATVRRALPAAKSAPEADQTTGTSTSTDVDGGIDDVDDQDGTSGGDQGAEDDLPLLPAPADREAERAAAR